jgi:hypothetical protein
MTKQVVVLSAIVAVVTSALTTAVWTAVTPASAAGGRVSVISKLNFAESYGKNVKVDAGDAGTSTVLCPDKSSIAISGGYVMTGTDVLGVASPTSSYAQKLGAPPGWEVKVTNPKSAGGSVTFQAKVLCVVEQFTQVPA